MSMFHYRYASATCSKAAQRRLKFCPKTHLKCIKTHIEATINQISSGEIPRPPLREGAYPLSCSPPITLSSAGPLLNTWRRACFYRQRVIICCSKLIDTDSHFNFKTKLNPLIEQGFMNMCFYNNKTVSENMKSFHYSPYYLSVK